MLRHDRRTTSAGHFCVLLVGFSIAVARGGPEASGKLQRIDNPVARPPGSLVSRFVKRIMMPITQWHGVLVRHLETHGPGLREFQVMGLRRSATADEAGLSRDEGQVIAIANSRFLRD